MNTSAAISEQQGSLGRKAYRDRNTLLSLRAWGTKVLCGTDTERTDFLQLWGNGSFIKKQKRPPSPSLNIFSFLKPDTKIIIFLTYIGSFVSVHSFMGFKCNENQTSEKHIVVIIPNTSSGIWNRSTSHPSRKLLLEFLSPSLQVWGFGRFSCISQISLEQLGSCKWAEVPVTVICVISSKEDEKTFSLASLCTEN